MKELFTAIIVYAIALCIIWVVISPFIPDWLLPWRRKDFKIFIEGQKIRLTGRPFAITNRLVVMRLESAELGIQQARFEGKFRSDGSLDLFLSFCGSNTRISPEAIEKLRQVLIDCSYFAQKKSSQKSAIDSTTDSDSSTK